MSELNSRKMQDWQKRAVEENLHALTLLTDCNLELIAIIQDPILSPQNIHLGYHEKAELEATSNPYGRSVKFYEMMKRKDNFYDPLISVLEQARQTGAAKILKDIRTERERFNVTTIAPAVPVLPSSSSNQSGHSSGTTGSGSEDIVDFTTITKPLVVAVKAPNNHTKRADYYNLPRNANHFALVVNIIEFEDRKMNRPGADHDTTYMSDLLTQLGYSVSVEAGKISKNELLAILIAFKRKFKNGNGKGSCVIFIGSHGRFNKISTSDGEEVHLYKEIIFQFDSNNCPELEGSPKLFLVQACQEFQEDSVAYDMPLSNPMDDTMLCSSTTPGYPSFRNMDLGTWFAYCLAKVFMEHAHHLDVAQLLDKTQDTLRKVGMYAGWRKGQLCSITNHGMRKLYLM